MNAITDLISELSLFEERFKEAVREKQEGFDWKWVDFVMSFWKYICILSNYGYKLVNHLFEWDTTGKVGFVWHIKFDRMSSQAYISTWITILGSLGLIWQYFLKPSLKPKSFIA